MDGYTTPEKAGKKKTKKNNSDINNSDILNGRYKSEDQKSAIKNIETLYESREKVIKLFNYHSKIASMAKYEAKMENNSKYLLLNKYFNIANSTRTSKSR